MASSISVVIFAGLLPLVAILALWVGSLYDKRLANVLYKLHLLRLGMGHMLFSTDKKFPKNTPDSGEVVEETVKQIIFVRHAESAVGLSCLCSVYASDSSFIYSGILSSIKGLAQTFRAASAARCQRKDICFRLLIPYLLTRH